MVRLQWYCPSEYLKWIGFREVLYLPSSSGTNTRVFASLLLSFILVFELICIKNGDSAQVPRNGSLRLSFTPSKIADGDTDKEHHTHCTRICFLHSLNFIGSWAF